MGTKQYIATGLCMMDQITLADGTALPKVVGGIPMYGYCGMRLWTDSIEFVARIGEDFFDSFDPWFHRNNIDESGLKVVSQSTPYYKIKYTKDFGADDESEFFTGNILDSDLWRPHGEDFDGLIGPETKGFYVTSPPAAQMWEQVLKLKERYHFNVMWEPNISHTFPADKDDTLKLCSQIEMASFNVAEGCRIFGVDTEQQLLTLLQNLHMELVLLRCGERGLYVIGRDDTIFIDSAPLPKGEQVVDVTGCGNTSTAGACVAWCQGKDLLMTGIMANISSNYNLRQKGPFPYFGDQEVGQANTLAAALYEKALKGEGAHHV